MKEALDAVELVVAAGLLEDMNLEPISPVQFRPSYWGVMEEEEPQLRAMLSEGIYGEFSDKVIVR